MIQITVQFVSKDDGNGRISRAIADYIFAHDTNEKYKVYSVSTAIYTGRREYYDMLDQTTNLYKNRYYDFTDWIVWHTNMLIMALQSSLDDVGFIIEKAKFWDRHRHQKFNERQVQVLKKLISNLSKGKLSQISPKSYREITGTSQVTASRDIKYLVEMECLRKVEGKGGRSTSYTLVFEKS